MAFKYLAQVVKAKNVRKGYMVLVGSRDEGGKMNSIDWREVTEVGADYDSAISVETGDGWEDSHTLRPDDRVLVIKS